MDLMRYENRLPILLRSLFEEDLDYRDDKHFSTSPAVNIRESLDDFIIEIAAPGFNKDDFNIELDRNRLLVSAEKKDGEHLRENEYFVRKEFSYHDFRHTFSLSEWVLKHKIDASYEDGILRITIPKKEEVKPKEPKSIRVK